MNVPQIARVIDLFTMAFVFGATSWFFFVQSPVLLKVMRREQFVPIQMRLTVVLFRALTAALLILVGASLGHSPITSATSITAILALVAGLINKFAIVPSALKAGGQSRSDIQGKDNEGSTANFASAGVGDRTKFFHRLVVLFVLVMVVGVVAHGIRLLAA